MAESSSKSQKYRFRDKINLDQNHFEIKYYVYRKTNLLFSTD